MWDPNPPHLGDIVNEDIVEPALALIREQLGEVLALGLGPDRSPYAIPRIEESQRGVTGFVSPVQVLAQTRRDDNVRRRYRFPGIHR
jgi:hypothetical protein